MYFQIQRKFFLKTDLKVDSYYAAKQYYLMGYYYDQIVKDSDSAFKNYTISKNFYERIGDSSWVGRNLLNMGTIQKDQSDFFGSNQSKMTGIYRLVIIYWRPIIESFPTYRTP